MSQDVDLAVRVCPAQDAARTLDRVGDILKACEIWSVPMDILMPGRAMSGVVLVIHSWWGLTPAFREYGKALAAEGYIVGLADLFDGQTAEDPAEAQQLRRKPRRLPMYKTLAADIETLRSKTGSRSANIGLVGFSMGGHWAVWLSQRPEYRIAATVLYYAARGGDFGRCTASILAHFADDDPWVSLRARNTMEKAIRKAGCSYHAYDYPATRHWFAESDRRGGLSCRQRAPGIREKHRPFQTTLACVTSPRRFSRMPTCLAGDT